MNESSSYSIFLSPPCCIHVDTTHLISVILGSQNESPPILGRHLELRRPGCASPSAHTEKHANHNKNQYTHIFMMKVFFSPATSTSTKISQCTTCTLTFFCVVMAILTFDGLEFRDQSPSPFITLSYANKRKQIYNGGPGMPRWVEKWLLGEENVAIFLAFQSTGRWNPRWTVYNEVTSQSRYNINTITPYFRSPPPLASRSIQFQI